MSIQKSTVSLADAIKAKKKQLEELQAEIKATELQLQEERKAQWKYKDRETAVAAISTKIAAIMVILEECQEIAKINDVEFSFDPAYGMGGWFGTNDDKEWGWQPSSQSC